MGDFEQKKNALKSTSQAYIGRQKQPMIVIGMAGSGTREVQHDDMQQNEFPAGMEVN